MIKKSLLVLAALLWVLTGCGQEKTTAETSWTTAQMAETLFALDGPAGFERVAAGEDNFTDYLSNYYHLDPENVLDGTVFYAGGTSALEVAVLQMNSTELADGAQEALQAYIEERTGAFTGYLPEEAAILEQSSAVSHGSYVALLICAEQQAAQEAFRGCFEGTEPPAESPLSQPNRPVRMDSGNPSPQQPAAPAPEPDEDAAAPEAEAGPEESPDGAEESPDTPPAKPDEGQAAATDPEPEPAPSVPEEKPAPEEKPEPEKPWSYDHSRLLAAWKAGDWSQLHTRDQEILDVCDGVMQALIRADMSDYDKELAIHDWMIGWASYDSDTLSHQQNAQPNPDHDNPYGFLIGKKGICLGYTSTFQLFMDMVGIECVTVHGTAYSKTEEHAWNMVKLDGEWYCVDVTWDDPTTYSTVSRMTAHMYFNVTSEFLRGRDHQWDESSVSEATATAYAWNPYA